MPVNLTYHTSGYMNVITLYQDNDVLQK